MPVEMAIPFRLGPDGSVAMVEEPFARTLQRVEAIAGTRPTERVMDMNFGLPLEALVFEADDEFEDLELQALVTRQMAIYEPGVVVMGVTPEDDLTGSGEVGVRVEIKLSEDPTTGLSQYVNTATIQPSGTVKEVIRG